MKRHGLQETEDTLKQIGKRILDQDDHQALGVCWKIMVETGAMQNFGMMLNKFQVGQEQQQGSLDQSITVILALLVDFSHFIEPSTKKNEWSISCFVETNIVTRLVILLEQICQYFKQSLE